MAWGRPKAALVVTATEREVLAQGARIVLACATGAPNAAVAARVRVTQQMVGKWRARCRVREFIDRRASE